MPHLKAGASIINTTSVTAWKGSQAMVDYSSTKGAIVTFTRSLALQLAPKHIRVNASEFIALPVLRARLTVQSRRAQSSPLSNPLRDRESRWKTSKWEACPFTADPTSRPRWDLLMVSHHVSSCGARLTSVFLASADSNAMTGQIMHLNNGQWIG